MNYEVDLRNFLFNNIGHFLICPLLCIQRLKKMNDFIYCEIVHFDYGMDFRPGNLQIVQTNSIYLTYSLR